MRNITINFLLAFATSAAANNTASTQDPIKDIFADKLVDRASKELSVPHGQLEKTTFGKPGHLASSTGSKYRPAIYSIPSGSRSMHPAHHGWRTASNVLNSRHSGRIHAEGSSVEEKEKLKAEIAQLEKDMAEDKTTQTKAVKSGEDTSKPLPGSGVNLFDPAATASRWLTRRFGIVGGLGLVGALALVEGNEFFQAIKEDLTTKEVVDTVEKPLANGLTYREIKVGGGRDINRDDFVGVKLVIKNGDQVVLDTTNKKPIAFLYKTEKPVPGYPGLIEGVKGMRRGGIRIISFPPNSDGSVLRYTVEVVEASPAYFDIPAQGKEPPAKTQ